MLATVVAGHHFCFTEPFDVGEGDKCESSPVLPSSLGRRCHHPVLLRQEWGMYQAPKKAFLFLVLDGRQPGQAAQQTPAPSDAHSSVAQLPPCQSVCRQRLPGTWHCHQNDPQGCLGSCHLPATQLLPATADPHSRGSSLPSEPVLVPPSEPWLMSAGAQPAQGMPDRCAHWGCSLCHHAEGAGVTSGAAAPHSGPACSTV